MAVAPSSVTQQQSYSSQFTLSWVWVAAWLALWVSLVIMAEVFPRFAPVIGIFAMGFTGIVIASQIYNGSLMQGLQNLGVPA